MKESAITRSARGQACTLKLDDCINDNGATTVFAHKNCGAIGEKVKDSEGKILRDNVWGTLEEDCIRRDFSINALYFDPIENNLCDFHSGLQHIQKKILVSIGDPLVRFEEDPVRSLRAIRFSSKLDFKISFNSFRRISL